MWGRASRQWPPRQGASPCGGKGPPMLAIVALRPNPLPPPKASPKRVHFSGGGWLGGLGERRGREGIAALVVARVRNHRPDPASERSGRRFSAPAWPVAPWARILGAGVAPQAGARGARPFAPVQGDRGEGPYRSVGRRLQRLPVLGDGAAPHAGSWGQGPHGSALGVGGRDPTPLAGPVATGRYPGGRGVTTRG